MRVRDAKKAVDSIWFNIYENTARNGDKYENNVAYINLVDKTYKNKDGKDEVSLGLDTVVDTLKQDGYETLRFTLKQRTVDGKNKYVIDLEPLLPKKA